MKYEKENENNEICVKTLEIKEEDIDNDKETDDILNKLENLSRTSEDKSFDSPIIFNRTKTFYIGYNTDSRNLLYENFTMNDNNVLNNDYIFKKKTFKRENRQKSLLNQTYCFKKENKRLSNAKSKSNIKNKELSCFHQEFQNMNIKKNFSKLMRHNSNNIFKHSNDIYNKKDNDKILPSIDENIAKNTMINKKIENINIKLENIILLIKDMKFIDKKLKKKDYKKYINNLKNKEINLDNILESIIELLDYILEMLNSSQNYNIKNDNKAGNEKIILKLQKELKEKDKEIGELLNKMNLEKVKFENSFNSTNIEIINLRKQNKDLNNKIFNMEKHISKLEANNGTLEEKINKIILEKTKKTMNSSNSTRSTFILNNISKIEPPSLDVTYISQNKPINNEQIKNNHKLNDKYNLSRKINLYLIDLLKEINNILIYYDTFINKECGVIKNNQNVAKNLINFMDINDLIEEKKMKMIANEFKRNMDIIFTKIEEYIKEVNKKKNSSEVKHNSVIKHSSTKVTLKNEKCNNNIKVNNNNKDNSNKVKFRNTNNLNMAKNLKNYNCIYTNINIPKRKRTKTINNSNNKDSI